MGEDDFIVLPFLSIRSSDQMRLNPTSEDCRAAFLIEADVIDQAPQFFPELCLFSRQTAGCPSKTVSLHITNPKFLLRHPHHSLNPVLSKPLP